MSALCFIGKDGGRGEICLLRVHYVLQVKMEDVERFTFYECIMFIDKDGGSEEIYLL